MTITIRTIDALARDEGRIAAWPGIVSHTHHMRSDKMSFEDCQDQAVRWCQKHDVKAIGIGSPWEPVSRQSYLHYEGPGRDLYYSGTIDQAALRDEHHIQGMLDDLNSRGKGCTHFYLDNETPKQRYGHLWWFGWHYDFPAWHDYSQDRPICYHDDDPHCELNALTGEPHRRRCYLEILAAQRSHGALGVWAHPTSWWRTGDAFVTNIAAEAGLHLLADGYLDGIAHMGYNAIHRPYNDLWFHFLDTGAIVPGFAETDNCHNEPTLMDRKRTFKSHMPVEGPMTVDAIKGCARRGASFSSTGAFCELTIDGYGMGDICPTSAGHIHDVELYIWPVPGQTRLSRIEFIGPGGRVLQTVDHFSGGRIQCALLGSDVHAYLLIRAYGEHDDPEASMQEIEHGLLSNPVYLHPPGHAVKAMTTEYCLQVTEGSPWLGGKLTFETADGTEIETGRVQPGDIRIELPASARACLRTESRRRMFYIAMENQAVQLLTRYLWNGEFLHDHPALGPGEVPVSAFALEDMRGALATCAYRI